MADQTVEPTGSSHGAVTQGLRGRFVDWAERRRKWLIGFGIGGSIVGLLFALIVSFLPIFKLIFQQANIDRTRLSRMTHILDSRSDRFVDSLVAAEVAGDADGKNRYFQARGWDRNHKFLSFYEQITGKPAGSNKRINKFFDQLERDKGFRFVREVRGIGGKDRLVLLRIENVNGSTIDLSDLEKKGGLANLDHLVAERFETNKEARIAWKKTIKDNTRFYQIIKRYNLRKWGYEKLGITKWRFFEGTREKVEQKVRARWTRAVTSKYLDGTLMRCMFNSECPKSSDPNAEENKPQSINTELESDLEAADTDANTESPQNRGTKFADSFAGKAIGRFIPFVNAVNNLDTLSSVHHAIGPDHGLVKAIAALTAAEAIYSYFEHSKITDNLKDGTKVSSEEVNAVMSMNDGFERSQAYTDVVGDNAGFSPMPSAYAAEIDQQSNLIIGSADNRAQDLTDAYKASGIGGAIGPIAGAWDAVPGIIKEPARIANSIVGFGFNLVNSLISTATGGNVDPKEGVKKLMIKLFIFLGGSPKCHGHQSAGRHFTCKDAGASALQEAFLESNGGHNISESEHVKQSFHAALDQRDEDKQRGAWSRLAAVDGTSSVLGQMLMQVPSSGQQLAQGFNRFIAMINPLGVFQFASNTGIGHGWVGRADAADSNPYKLKRSGLTEAELTQDPWGGKDESQCTQEEDAHNDAVSSGDESPPGSICLTDDDVANALTCFHSDQDCAGIGTAPETTCVDSDNSSAACEGGQLQDYNGDSAALAKDVLKRSNITYQAQCGVNAKDLIQMTVDGKKVPVQVTGAQVFLDSRLLRILLQLADNNLKINVSAITNCTHTAGSQHYTGTAMDVGNAGFGNEELTKIQHFLYTNRRKLEGIDQVIWLGPGHETNHQLDSGRPTGDATYSDHQDHLHFSVTNQ